MAVDVQWLLDKLCVDLGFCLPPREQERILALALRSRAPWITTRSCPCT